MASLPLNHASDSTLRMIQRRAAINTKKFLDVLEESYGEWEKDSFAGSDDEDGGGKGSKKRGRKGKKRKDHALQRKAFDYDLATSGYVGETFEIQCFPKLVVSFDQLSIQPKKTKFLQVQTAWIETPDRPIRSFKINPDSLLGSDSGLISQELMEEFLSSSSDDETTDGEGGGAAKDGRNGDAESSSGSDIMSLHSDASSDDFNEDQTHLAEELDILNESFHAS